MEQQVKAGQVYCTAQKMGMPSYYRVVEVNGDSVDLQRIGITRFNRLFLSTFSRRLGEECVRLIHNEHHTTMNSERLIKLMKRVL